MKEYIDYLKRYTRTTNVTLAQAHKELLCRLIAREYGVNETEMDRLDKEL